MKHVDKEEQATKRRQLRTKLGAYNFTSHVILFFSSVVFSFPQPNVWHTEAKHISFSVFSYSTQNNARKTYF